jgi:transcriptional regulator with XRE-family HTH domain
MNDDQRESGPVDLPGSLRMLRQRAQLGQIEAARRSSISQAKLSRIETGKSIPTPAEAATMAEAYGATPHERDRLAEAAATLATQYVDSRVILQSGAHHFQQRVRETEEAATLIRSYQPALVLGVLQTRDYANTVFSSSRELIDEREAEASVQSRMTRWQLLTDPARHWRLIQTEAALRWVVKSPAVMADQLDQVAEASRLPNVTLGIIRLDTVAPEPAPLHGFHIYDDDSVMFGTETGTALLSDPSRITYYSRLFDEMAELAVYDDEVRQLLANLATDYRATAQ